MGNVLSEEKRQQVIALGRLGWSLRRIEQATGVRRETGSAHLKAAGIGVRPAGAWGRRLAAKRNIKGRPFLGVEFGCLPQTIPERSTPFMTSTTKYIGMDVHKESISIAVRNAGGKIAMESVIETKANTILEIIDGLRGEGHVTLEEGTWSEWLYDLLKPHVRKLVVCDPRRNALLKEGNQNDRVDARKLAELLQNNQLRPVYHVNHGLRTMKELVRSYLTITKDLSRV